MITMGYALPKPSARKSSTRSETSDRPLSPIPTNAGNGWRWLGRMYRSIASLSNSSACSSGRFSTSSNSLSLLVTCASYSYSYVGSPSQVRLRELVAGRVIRCDKAWVSWRQQPLCDLLVTVVGVWAGREPERRLRWRVPQRRAQQVGEPGPLTRAGLGERALAGGKSAVPLARGTCADDIAASKGVARAHRRAGPARRRARRRAVGTPPWAPTVTTQPHHTASRRSSSSQPSNSPRWACITRRVDRRCPPRRGGDRPTGDGDHAAGERTGQPVRLVQRG